jgi:hypothetical protein
MFQVMLYPHRRDSDNQDDHYQDIKDYLASVIEAIDELLENKCADTMHEKPILDVNGLSVGITLDI